MKLHNTRKIAQKGFTLIEMIGVLAVIAILAALLIPKIFEAINNSRINNAAVSCETVKSAVADHYAKSGSLNVDGSGAAPVVLAAPYTAFDQILVKEGFLDKPFITKIGDGIRGAAATRVQLVTAVANTVATAGANDAAYNLDGDAVTTAANDASGSFVVEAVISNVMANDAWELSKRIDGPADPAVAGGTAGYLSENANTTADLRGRVKYAAPANGVTTVYVYLTHR